MKKYYILLSLFVSIALGSFGQQVLLQENFNSAASLPAGWQAILDNNTVPSEWEVGNNLSSANFIIPANDGNYAVSNDNACQCNLLADRLITSGVNFTGVSGAFLRFKSYLPSPFAPNDSKGHIFLVDNLNNYTWIQAITPNAGWTTYDVPLTAATGTMKIAFVHTDSTAIISFSGWAIDDVQILAPYSKDLTVTQLLAPTSGCLSNTETVQVTLQNVGTTVANNFSVNYSINGGIPVNQNLLNLGLQPGASYNHTFLVPVNLTSGAGSTIVTTVVWPGDLGLDNNSYTTTVTRNSNVINGVTEAFNGNASYVWGIDNSSKSTAVFSGNQVILAGTGAVGWTGTAGSTTSTNAWTNNTDYQSSVYLLCNSGKVPQINKSLELSFDLRQETGTSVLYNWFGVFVNGVQVADVDGTLNFNPTTQNADLAVNRKFNLSAFKNTEFVVELRASTNKTTDKVFIDNVLINERNEFDAGIVSILSPESNCDLSGTQSLQVTMKNYGLTSLINIPVYYQVDNGTAILAGVYAGPLAVGATSPTVTFNNMSMTALGNAGTHTLKVYTQVTGDNINSANDFQEITVIHQPEITVFPYEENFEGNSNWSVSGTNASWEFGVPSGVEITPTEPGSKAMITNASGSYNANEVSYVTSPCFDFTSLSNAYIQFSLYVHSDPEDDGAQVQYSINNGQWLLLGTVPSPPNPTNWYFDNVTSLGNTGGWSAVSNGWVTASFDLGAAPFANASNVRFRFKFASDGDNTGPLGEIVFDGIAIDNLFIGESQAEYDLKASSLLSPVSGSNLTSTEMVSVQVINTGLQAVTTFQASYKVDAQATVTETFNQTIAAGASATITFTTPADFSAVTSHTVVTTVILANDGNITNNTSTSTVLNELLVNSFPYSETFNGVNHQWTSGGIFSSWQLAVPSGTDIVGDPAVSPATDIVWVTNANAGGYYNSENSYVQSPEFDFSNLIQPAMSMRISYNTEPDSDGARISVSTDGGNTFTAIGVLASLPNLANWYVNTVDAFAGAAGWTGTKSWVLASQDLSSLAGESSVIFRVYFAADGNVTDEGFAFDDFSVIEAAPHDLALLAWTTQTSGCGLTSAEAITVSIKNNGVFTENDFAVSYSIDLNGNVTTVTENVTGANLAAGATMDYTFTQLANFDVVGTYVCTSSVSINIDASAGNNTINQTINSYDVISSFPQLYTFESSDGGWFSGGTNSSFEMGTPSAGNALINTAAGGVKAWVTNLDGSHNVNEDSYVESQCYNVSGVTIPAISFDYIINTEIFNGSIAFDGARLEVSTNGGSTWTVLGNVGDTTNWYNYNSVSVFGEAKGWAGNSAGWKHTTYHLDDYVGATSLKFRFAFKADGFNTPQYEGFGLDNIRIFNDMPSDVGVTVISDLSNCEFTADVPVTVTVKNLSTENVHMAGSQIPVSFTFDGNTYNESFVLAANFLPGETVDYTFTATVDIPVSGPYSISAETTLQYDVENLNNGTSANFTSYPSPVLSSTVTDALCLGSSDGTITLATNPGFTYLWDASALGATTQNVTGLEAGNYYVTITSDHGCVLEAGPVSVGEPTLLAVTGTYTDAGCDGASDGTVSVTITGGTLPYSTSWNAGAFVSEDLDAVPAGSYHLLVTDANACTTTIDFTLIDAFTLPIVENFESLALPIGWARTQNAQSVGWEFGTNINNLVFPFFAIPNHTGYAASNDNKNDDFSGTLNDASNDLLISPRLDLTNYTHVNLQFDAFFEGFADVASVVLTTNGGTSWTTLSTIASNPSWQEDLTVSLDAYIGLCNVQIGFKYNDGGDWGNGFAIDNVSILGTVQPQFDLAVTDISTPAASSCSFGNTEAVTVAVSNLGTSAAVNAVITLTVNGQLLATESLPTIASGANMNYTFVTTFDFDAAGTYILSAEVALTNDVEVLNNSISETVVSYPTISSFPYSEDFSDANFGGFAVNNGSQASATYSAGAFVLAGGNPLVGWTGGANATATNAWVDNTLHQASASTFCTIDATGMSSLELFVDMKQVFSNSPSNSWFRILVNGSAVTGNYNPATINDPYQTIQVDLDAYLASPFTLEFQASNNTINDKVFIDNLLLRAKQADVAVTGISVASQLCSYSDNETVSVSLSNEGGLPLTGFDLALVINGSSVSTITYNGTIAVGGNASYNFTGVDLSAFGTKNIVVTATLANDVDLLNNFSETSFLNSPTYSAYPFAESASNFGTYWVGAGTNSSWAFTNGIWETGAGNATYNTNESSAITSPCFDFSNLTDPVVQFDFGYVTENNVDIVAFEYSVNGGAWTVLTNALGGTNWYTGTGSGSLTNRTVTCNTGLGGLSNVKFRLSMNSDEADNYTGMNFSNFKVFDMPDLSVTAITPLTVCATAPFEVAATVTNAGDYSLSAGTQISLSYTLNASTTTETFTLAIDLAAGASQVFTFTADANINTANTYAISGTVVTGFDYNAGNNSYSNNLLVLAAPVIGSVTNIGICEGNSVTLSATGGVSYVWSGGVTQGVAFFPQSTSNYTVTVTNALGCEATSQVQVEVHALPIASAGAEQFVCSGTQTTVTATGGTNYQWINGGTDASFSYTVNSTETYTVIVSDGNGCSDYASVTVNELDLPVGTISTDQTICLGETASLLAGGGVSYLWSTGGTAAGIDVTPAVTSSYTVTVYNATMCEDVKTVGVTVINQPVIEDAVVLNNHCYLGAAGSIELTASGAAPISYIWSGSISNTSIATGLSAGTYTVTIQDAFGTQCQTVASYTITQPAGPVLAAIVDNSGNVGYSISCNGANDGSLFALGTNGTAPYNYSWSNSILTSANVDLAAGLYSVTVNDIYGCTATASYTVTEPTALSATVSYTDVTCNGAQNGSFVVNATGGVQPYSYTWGPSNSVSSVGTLNGLSGGSYTVTVTDANGCTWTGSVSIFEPTPLAYSTLSQSSYNGYGISCPGGNNGYIEVVGTGGNGSFVYNWNTSATTASITNLTSGTYTVTITDAKNCSVTHSYSLTAPLFMATSSLATMVSCNGGSNGAVNLNVVGGVTPYSYNWTSGQVTEDLTGITAGLYTVTITDANGCTTTKSATITQPAALVTSASVTSNLHGAHVSCPGSTNGSAAVVVSGGTIPYTYLWSNEGGTTTSSLSGIGAGTYTVTVSDTKGCTSVSSITLIDPQPVTASTVANSSYGPNATNVSCFGGNNGSATVTPAGGTAPYTYAWSTSASTTATVNTLVAGLHTITVTDINGCATTTSVTLTQPSALLVDVTLVNSVSCTNDDDGSLTVSATGGIGSYAYNWSGALGTSTTVSALHSGTYTVSVTDENGCVVTDSYVLVNPTPVVADLIITSNYNGYSVSCNGSSNGSLQINATGGTGAYSYHWNNDPLNTNNTASNLAALAYIVTVTDSKGCTASDFVLMTQPTSITATGTLSAYNGNNVSCNGGSNGEIAVVAGGGVGTLSYAWSNGQGNLSTVNGLAAGMYTVTVTDINNCSTPFSYTLTEPGALSLSFTSTDYNGYNVSCNGSADGTLTAAGVSGTAPYTYSWSTGSTDASITGLSAVTYTVTVTDLNACQFVNSYTLTQPAVFAIGSVSATSNYDGYNVSCEGRTDGSASLVLATGIAPFTYMWSNGETVQNPVTLPSGISSVTITDANNCSVSGQVSLTSPSTFNVNTAVTSNYNGLDVTCTGAANGIVEVSPVTGFAPYGYSWSNGAITSTVSSLAAGVYTVTVTDNHGCVATSSVQVHDAAPLSYTFIQDNVDCNGNGNGSIDISVAGGTTGNYMYFWSNSTNGEDVSGLTPGMYYFLVIDMNWCHKVSEIFTITQPEQLVVNAQVASNYNGFGVSCNGEMDASIQSTVSGGVQPYSYSWNNVAGASSLNAIGTGTYNLVVTDANNCVSSASATVSTPAAVVAGISASNYHGYNVSCIGSNDGILTASVVSGGFGPFSYSWTGGFTTAQIGGLVAGTYTVTVTDATGCFGVASYTITEPSALSVSVTALSNYGGFEVSCATGADGQVSSLATGGVAPYTYYWSNGSVLTTAGGLPSGLVSVTVTDNNGCSTVGSIMLDSPAALDASVSVSHAITCFGATDGSLTVSATGGFGSYTYNWATGAVTQSISNVPAGSYQVTVSDALGCSTVANFTFTSVAPMIMSVAVNNITCNGLNDGSAVATVTGGTAPYSFYWNNGSVSSSLSNLTPGMYYGFALDVHNCATNFVPFVISTPSAMALSATLTNVSCNGAADGAVNITVAGGNLPYTYTWSNGATSEDISGVSGGNYSVTIADANNCQQFGTYSVTEGAAFVVNSTTQDADCQNGGVGSIDLTVSGGVSPYTFSWSTGAITEDLSGLAAGSYAVTVQDGGACAFSQSFTIAAVSPIVVNAIGTDVSCNGGNNGSIDVTVSGGTGTYYYNWTGPNQSVSSLFNWDYAITSTNATILIPGNLAVNVNGSPIALGDYIGVFYDNNGVQVCGGYTEWQGAVTSIAAWGAESTDNGFQLGENYIFKIWQASTGLVFDATAQFDAINFPDGGAFVINGMSGLSDVSAVVPADLTGLSVGNYQVIVNDTQGCSGVASVTIQQPAVLEAITSAVSISCLNSVDGSANVAVTGGVAPYTYSWNNGGTDATITALATGNYTVNVTDSHGCITSAMAQVTAPIFDLSAIATNPTYVGGADGSIELTVSGDFGPFTYNWSNNAVTEDLNGLTAGTYVVTVMAGSCQYTESYTLTEGVTPDALAVSSAIVSDVNCLNGNDGLIDLTVEGGVMPYSYSWSNGALVQDLTGLTAGSYTVTITDAAPIMNSLVVTYTIDQPTTSVSMTYVTDNPTSCLLDGSISILVEGGTAPYTYEWSNGSTNEDLTQVGSGSYSVLIADANGCTYNSASINLVAYTMDLSVSVTPNVCNGGNDASVSVIVNNQLPQSFVWSNGGTTDYVENLTAGNYVVTVTDYYGCSVVENVAVVDPAPIVVSIATGSIGFTATVISGATGPVSYMWSNGKPYQSIKNLVSGTTYCVTVTDINGCTGTACAVWGSASMPMALNLTKEEMVAALTEVDFNLYPNPNMDGQFNLAVPAVEIDEMQVEVSDNTGRVIYSQSYSSVNDMNVFISLNRADAGVYYVRLILNNQKAITKRMVIIR